MTNGLVDGKAASQSAITWSGVLPPLHCASAVFAAVASSTAASSSLVDVIEVSVFLGLVSPRVFSRLGIDHPRLAVHRARARGLPVRGKQGVAGRVAGPEARR